MGLVGFQKVDCRAYKSILTKIYPTFIAIKTIFKINVRLSTEITRSILITACSHLSLKAAVRSYDPLIIGLPLPIL